MGKGVLKAVANVNEKIAPAIMGMDPTQQAKIDRTMMEVDKTENKVNDMRFIFSIELSSVYSRVNTSAKSLMNDICIFSHY